MKASQFLIPFHKEKVQNFVTSFPLGVPKMMFALNNVLLIIIPPDNFIVAHRFS